MRLAVKAALCGPAVSAWQGRGSTLNRTRQAKVLNQNPSHANGQCLENSAVAFFHTRRSLLQPPESWLDEC